MTTCGTKLIITDPSAPDKPPRRRPHPSSAWTQPSTSGTTPSSEEDEPINNHALRNGVGDKDATEGEGVELSESFIGEWRSRKGSGRTSVRHQHDLSPTPPL